MGLIVIDKTKKQSTHVYYNKGENAGIGAISRTHLRDIKSRVTTHEGELLTGKKGREYLDKWSAKYKGKDLAGSYRDERIR